MTDRCAGGFKITSGPCKTCGATQDEGCRRYPSTLEAKLAAVEAERDALTARIAAMEGAGGELKATAEDRVAIKRQILAAIEAGANQADIAPLSQAVWRLFDKVSTIPTLLDGISTLREAAQQAYDVLDSDKIDTVRRTNAMLVLRAALQQKDPSPNV